MVYDAEFTLPDFNGNTYRMVFRSADVEDIGGTLTWIAGVLGHPTATAVAIDIQDKDGASLVEDTDFTVTKTTHNGNAFSVDFTSSAEEKFPITIAAQ